MAQSPMIARYLTSGYGKRLCIERLSQRGHALCGARVQWQPDGYNDDCPTCLRLYAHMMADA